ncbi:MAG: acyl-CoA dehydratase activase [Anaerovoracaceae bacterium]|jgi:predicted CoA-substrate-specific enzyme activase
MIYYACRYFPLLAAQGLGQEAEMINGAAEDFSRADALIHENTCGYAKALIGSVLEGNVRELVLTSCCDCMKRTFDVLQEYGDLDFFYELDLPHDDNSCAKEYYAAQIEGFIHAYEQYKGVSFDAGLLEEVTGKPPASFDHVLLTGGRASDELVADIKKISGLPLVNTTCSGAHPYTGPLPKFKGVRDFASWYGDLLLSQPGCMRMNDISLRRTGIEDPHVKGVIYHTVKFCEFYPFEYSRIKGRTRLPMTRIETDFTRQSAGQIRTRVEGLMENISGEIGMTGRVNSKGGYAVGIDSGSTSTNAVILDLDGGFVAAAIVPTGVRIKDSSARAVAAAMENAGITEEDVYSKVATGYGRNGIAPDGSTVTEISCHARGARWLDPDVRTVIDIGGQDSKVIALDDDGSIRNFVMNDKCAAGTGRFLDNMARVLETDMDTMSERGLRWQEDLTISSMCTVFAESEVVSLIADGKNESDIIHGLNKSVALKISSLVSRVGRREKIMMTGGVARNRGVVKAIEEQLDCRLVVPEKAQLAGAIGAALYALQ